MPLAVKASLIFSIRLAHIEGLTICVASGTTFSFYLSYTK